MGKPHTAAKGNWRFSASKLVLSSKKVLAVKSPTSCSCQTLVASAKHHLIQYI